MHDETKGRATQKHSRFRERSCELSAHDIENKTDTGESAHEEEFAAIIAFGIASDKPCHIDLARTIFNLWKSVSKDGSACGEKRRGLRPGQKALDETALRRQLHALHHCL
jgi:predicted protein tyrosine phosphatase